MQPSVPQATERMLTTTCAPSAVIQRKTCFLVLHRVKRHQHSRRASPRSFCKLQWKTDRRRMSTRSSEHSHRRELTPQPQARALASLQLVCIHLHVLLKQLLLIFLFNHRDTHTRRQNSATRRVRIAKYLTAEMPAPLSITSNRTTGVDACICNCSIAAIDKLVGALPLPIFS